MRRFILTSVPSVPYLEALLLLRDEPGLAWTGASVARRLYLSPEQGAELLAGLGEAGVAQPQEEGGDIRWQYRPDLQLGTVLDEVAVEYAKDLVGVIRLIHSRVDKRAQHFADAFRWRKDS